MSSTYLIEAIPLKCDLCFLSEATRLEMLVPTCNPSCVLGRQRQEDLEFEASLGDLIRFYPGMG